MIKSLIYHYFKPLMFARLYGMGKKKLLHTYFLKGLLFLCFEKYWFKSMVKRK